MRFLAFPVLCLVLALAPLHASAQGTTGRIIGTIRDPTLAIVPGVRVTATDAGSRRQWTTLSDDGGAYTFPTLPAAEYRITTLHAGFKSLTAHVSLEVHQIIRLEIRLEVGTIDETVEVTTNGAVLQTDSTEVGLVIDTRENASLPINGRNFISLTFLMPGVVATNLATFTNGQRSTSGGRPYVNGNRKEANNFQLDGVDNNQTTDNLVSYQPSPDAIQEFKLITANAPAEYGNYHGAIINVTLKSGTNQLRGTLFEFFRDDSLNATNWASKWMPRDPLNAIKPPLTYHVFGGTVGGPLISNRAFVFTDYQATRRRSGYATESVSLIPSAMRRGDFSALLEGANPQQLYDPLTTRPDPANPDRLVRDPFPNNQIPIERISTVTAALFASPFYPEPTLPGPIHNAHNAVRTTLNNDQFDIKIDAKATARDDVSVRYANGRQTTATINRTPILMGDATRSPFQAAAISWNRQLGPHLLNEARIGFNRIAVVADGAVDVGGLGDLGEAVGIPGANRLGPGLPAMTFVGANVALGRAKVVQSFDNNTFQYQDNLIWHRGNHVAKAGFLAMRYQQNVYFSGNTGQLGLYEFNGQYTRDLNDQRSLGSPIADFVLGYPRRAARGDFAAPWGHRSTLWAGFLQDDWRASRDVTLNLGLRYEYRTPFVEVHDRQVNFELTTGRALFAGQDGNSRGLFEGYKYDWQPRVGIAWNPALFDQRLVLRGAYTISSFLEGTGTNLRLTLNPPFFNEFETVNANPAVLGPSISEGFSALREKDPLTGTILRAWDPKHRPARSQQWNVTSEYQLTRATAVSLGYVGQYGTHLVVPVNYNQRPSPSAARPFDAAYPQISAVILTTPNARQRYDALQAMARKRFSDGLAFVASYTWSHAMSNARGFFSDGGQTAEQAAFWANPRNPDAEWGPTPFDVRHVLSFGTVFELPWGHGRRFLSGGPGWLDAIAGGWSVAGIFKAHTGFAITITAPDQSQTGARTGRPDRIGSGRGAQEVGPGGLWFDTSAFLLPATATFGNAGVGIVRGPGLRVLDLSTSKKVHLSRRYALELRAEFFNVFNTPVFMAPDRFLTSPTFGQVRGSQLEREIQLAAKLLF